uniref:Uncharacterized protein n=1 Tax=Quercus lobata TaxID=97700 RepID=A0A7N2N3C3_QUELO
MLSEDGLKVGSENQEGVSGVRPRRFLSKKKEMPAVSRSTHRRFLRRKARREHYEAMAQEDAEKNRDSNVVEDGRSLENEIKEGENGDESLSTILEQMSLEEEEDMSNGASFESNEAEVDMVNEGLDHVEMSSQADESVDASYADDDWSFTGYLHACVLTFVPLQFSLPLPQGGREAIAKNVILREDQLPQKFLHPKTKKKMNKQGDGIFTADDFGHHVDKRAPLQPPVRKALAVFSGKRNPNDNHFSRSKH